MRRSEILLTLVVIAVLLFVAVYGLPDLASGETVWTNFTSVDVEDWVQVSPQSSTTVTQDMEISPDGPQFGSVAGI